LQELLTVLNPLMRSPRMYSRDFQDEYMSRNREKVKDA